MTRRPDETTDAYHARLAATPDQPQAVPDMEMLRKLAEAAAKVAPGPWEAEGEETEGGYGKHDEFVILDANGLRLCGTENADTSFGSISEENDGDGGHYQWNEPARVLMHFIAACDPATILSLLAARPVLPVETPAEGLCERPKTKEWKAVHGRSIANDCWFVKVYPLETEANAVAAKAAILAACANPLTQDAPAGIKVKPIEWGENGYAETPIGTYVLELDHDADGGPSHIGVELQTPFVELHWIKTKSNPTWDEAKAAAQADYDRRICSALASTAPAPPVWQGWQLAGGVGGRSSLAALGR